MAAGLDAGRIALENFIAHLAHERRASPRTLESYRHGVSTYLVFLERHRGAAVLAADLSGVSAAELRAFLAFRRSEAGGGLSPRSLSQNLSAVRAFHRWLSRRQGIANDAIALVRGPKIKPALPRPVSEDQARGLILEAAADDALEPWEAARDAAVLTLLYGCGLRISEALSLRGSDTPLGETLRITGKGGKTRISPVLRQVAAATATYARQCPYTLAPDLPLFRAQARRRPVAPARAGDDGQAQGRPWPARPGDTARPAPFLRHPPSGRRRGPSLHPGASRPRLPLHHAEIHGGGRGEPAGHLRQGASAGVGRIGGEGPMTVFDPLP